MEDIVYEIIGGALILGIILVVIMVFRNGSEAVKEAGNSQMQSEVKIEQTIAMDGAKYGPSKIEEAMKYAAVADISTQVIIRDNASWIPLYNGTSRTATGNSFDPESSLYKNKKYTLDIQYYKTAINASTQTSAANLLPDNNTQGTMLVRFLFYR